MKVALTYLIRYFKTTVYVKNAMHSFIFIEKIWNIYLDIL